MVVVLVVASGAAWESAALELIGARSGMVVLKRCVDVDELLAAGTAGQADAALVALDAPGLDQAAVDLLHRHQVRVVAVADGGSTESARSRATRAGVDDLAHHHDLGRAVDLLARADEPSAPVPDPAGDDLPAPAGSGRVVAVWGPAGAPGRTTVATGLAAALAGRGLRTTLVDADPYAASVAQHLGVLDEVSGLLSAARLAAAGTLEEGFGSVQRGLADHLTVVTGLPRADRWVEVRAGVVEHLLDVARGHGNVVVDTGFGLEDDPASDLMTRPGRNASTLAALDTADEIVVVGAADPVGLTRLARGLVDLRERRTGAPVRVVVNRMRGTLGWSERDITGMVEGFARLTDVHFLPDDRATADRALVTGTSVADDRDTALGRAVSALAEAVVPSPSAGRVHRSRLRTRTTRRARRR